MIKVPRRCGYEKVEFTATRKEPKKKRVSFRTSSGDRVSFTATRMVSSQEKVSFLAKKKK